MAEEVIDQICWECYGTSLVDWKCSTCTRSFHKLCASRFMEIIKPFVGNWRCPMCHGVHAEPDKKKNMKLLPFIANRALEMEKVRLLTTTTKPYTAWHLVVLLWTASQSALMLKPSMFVHAHLRTLLFSAMFEYICLFACLKDLLNEDNRSVSELLLGSIYSAVEPMYLKTMYRKIQSHSYTNFGDFLADVWKIKNTADTFYADRPRILSCLTELCDDFRGAINDGKDCADCYINEGFSKVCNEPHLVVWIKWIDSCYWPAKLIVVQNGGFVKVKLFGSHEEVRISFNNCFLCAEMTTFQLQNASTAYGIAMEELNEYFTNARVKFGEIQYFKKKAKLEIQKIGECIRFMYFNSEMNVTGRKNVKKVMKPSKKDDMPESLNEPAVKKPRTQSTGTAKSTIKRLGSCLPCGPSAQKQKTPSNAKNITSTVTGSSGSRKPFEVITTSIQNGYKLYTWNMNNPNASDRLMSNGTLDGKPRYVDDDIKITNDRTKVSKMKSNAEKENAQHKTY